MFDRVTSVRMPVAAQDVMLASFVAAMQVQGVLQIAARSEVVSRPLSDFGNLGTVLLIVSGLVLAVRRRWPVPVLLATGAASAAYYALDFPDGPGGLALMVALYTVTAYGDGRRSLAVAGAAIAVLATAWLVAAQGIEPASAIGWVFFRIGISGMSATLGESVRSRRVIAAEAVERAEAAERTREEEARARVDAERLRIAREVHDTVAHAIAVINVQAGVTAHLLDKRPERVRETLEAIKHASSAALQEMRTILGVLRDPADGREPHPGLGQIGDLTARAREAGLDVRLDASPPPYQLPSAVDSTAYRVVQESITNVIRHVGPTQVTISLAYGLDELEVQVVDEGSQRAPRGAVVTLAGEQGSGRGILGMRERCQLLGGDVTARPRAGGGFEVVARLPHAPVGSAL
ncbi:sensor histidine kinase [Glycomyces sp. YM15]|uniref:sensor histidine kinase n=1 Tax=Glycomyces sp. YM15 TaxID=2800446 RepID=UPI00196647FE|nr:sensor histidine kinase [Glycomyces sp. YM15]